MENGMGLVEGREMTRNVKAVESGWIELGVLAASMKLNEERGWLVRRKPEGERRAVLTFMQPKSNVTSLGKMIEPGLALEARW
jgi:hypothetical protein